jgi:hypothetical protein
VTHDFDITNSGVAASVPFSAPSITATGLSTSLIVLAAGTPITSQSSANSQMVTCPATGIGTQVCDAAGNWITSSGTGLSPTGATTGATSQSQVFIHSVITPILQGNSSGVISFTSQAAMGSGAANPTCYTAAGGQCTQLGGAVTFTTGTAPTAGVLFYIVDGGANRSLDANCVYFPLIVWNDLALFNSGGNGTVLGSPSTSVAPSASTTYYMTYMCSI